MRTLIVNVVLLSLVALAHQNYVQVLKPFNYWLEDGYLFKIPYQHTENEQFQSDDPALDQVQDRSIFSSSKFSNTGNMMNRARPFFNMQSLQESRFLTNIGNILLPKTSYVFASTTPTVTSTVYCTATLAFTTAGGVPTSCIPARRRRTFLEADENDSILPSYMIPAPPSVMAVANPWAMKKEVDIISSKNDETEQYPSTGPQFNPRQLRFLGSTTTKTVTTIATVVTSTSTFTIQSSIINNAGQTLKCIAPGGKVC